MVCVIDGLSTNSRFGSAAPTPLELCSLGLLLGFHVGLCRPDDGDLDGTPADLVLCSTGLLLGFHVGLCRPDEGDFVGDPPS